MNPEPETDAAKLDTNRRLIIYAGAMLATLCVLLTMLCVWQSFEAREFRRRVGRLENAAPADTVQALSRIDSLLLNPDAWPTGHPLNPDARRERRRLSNGLILPEFESETESR